MLDKWHKKEKPVFTGISRGLGGFGFGGAAAAETPPTVEVLFASYSSSYTDSGGTDDSSTKVLSPYIQYLYVLGTGGGGGGNYANGSDTGGGGGGGAGSIRRLVGYSIPGASQGQPIQVKVGKGGSANNSGAATVIQINGSTVLSIGGGSNGNGLRNGGAGGTVSSPGLTRLSPFPADFEATGGTGGSGAIRDSVDSTVGNSGGPTYGTGGGGGGGAHLSPKDGRTGGTSTNPGGPYTYNFFQKNHAGSFPNPFPAVMSPIPGGTQAADDGQGASAPQRGENKGLATGGGGYGQDSNTGRSGGAGGGFRIDTPNDLGPTTSIHGGGGGGIRSQIGPPNNPATIMGGQGGGGFIIVVGSSYLLESGTDY